MIDSWENEENVHDFTLLHNNAKDHVLSESLLHRQQAEHNASVSSDCQTNVRDESIAELFLRFARVIFRLDEEPVES